MNKILLSLVDGAKDGVVVSLTRAVAGLIALMVSTIFFVLWMMFKTQTLE